MVLMFQREVVERIAAKAGSSDRGYLTVLVEAFLSVERLFDVAPTAFSPEPKVWSSIVRLIPKSDEPALAGREDAFLTLVSTGFRQKRKTILNNLKAAGFEITRSRDVNEVLSVSGIDPLRRAETLTVDEWISLLNALG
jgi:16S rRNA (adenine1518-N6/adenine1519-N6)-dimethyltransferase